MKLVKLLILTLTLHSMVQNCLAGGEGGNWPVERSSIERTDQNAVFAAGSPQRVSISELGRRDSIFRTDTEAVLRGDQSSAVGEAFRLDSGLYELGGIRSWSESTHYMLFEEDVNNPKNYVAIIFPKDLRKDGKSEGYIMTGFPFGAGDEVIMVDFIVDQQGNASNTAMYAEQGSHIRVVKNGQDKGREFFLKGSHPLLQGKNVWGMKSSSRSRPKLGIPQIGVYGGNSNNPGALISKGEVSYGGQSYSLFPINGSNGALIGLTQSSTNIMGGYATVGAKIIRMMIFIQDCWDSDVIVDVKVHNDWGRYSFTYMETSFEHGFIETVSTFLDDLFSGRR